MKLSEKDPLQASAERKKANSIQSNEANRSRFTQKLWAAAGFLAFALGCIGAVLPIIPTTPFILVAAFCFARSSKRLNDWFRRTTLYKKVLEDFATKRTMTLKAKLTILIPVTILLALAFFMMHAAPIGQAVVAIVWVAHIIYFGFVVKLERPKNNKAPLCEHDVPGANSVQASNMAAPTPISE